MASDQAETEVHLKAAGVKRVAIPASGKLSEERHTLERSRTFRRGYRWHAGTPGRFAMHTRTRTYPEGDTSC